MHLDLADLFMPASLCNAFQPALGNNLILIQ